MASDLRPDDAETRRTAARLRTQLVRRADRELATVLGAVRAHPYLAAKGS